MSDTASPDNQPIPLPQYETIPQVPQTDAAQAFMRILNGETISQQELDTITRDRLKQLERESQGSPSSYTTEMLVYDQYISPDMKVIAIQNTAPILIDDPSMYTLLWEVAAKLAKEPQGEYRNAIDYMLNAIALTTTRYLNGNAAWQQQGPFIRRFLEQRQDPVHLSEFKRRMFQGTCVPSSAMIHNLSLFLGLKSTLRSFGTVQEDQRIVNHRYGIVTVDSSQGSAQHYLIDASYERAVVTQGWITSKVTRVPFIFPVPEDMLKQINAGDIIHIDYVQSRVNENPYATQRATFSLGVINNIDTTTTHYYYLP